MSSCISKSQADNFFIQGRPELKPVAIRAGKLLARRMFDKSQVGMDYESVSVLLNKVGIKLEFEVKGSVITKLMSRFKWCTMYISLPIQKGAGILC